MPTRYKVRFSPTGIKLKNKLELYSSSVVDNFMSNKRILSWDKRRKKWHLMIPIWTGDMITASCEFKKRPGNRFVDYTTVEFSKHGHLSQTSQNTFPAGILLKDINVNQIFKYKNICKSCIKKEISNIKEFKNWLVLQKLKYL